MFIPRGENKKKIATTYFETNLRQALLYTDEDERHSQAHPRDSQRMDANSLSHVFIKAKLDGKID